MSLSLLVDWVNWNWRPSRTQIGDSMLQSIMDECSSQEELPKNDKWAFNPGNDGGGVPSAGGSEVYDSMVRNAANVAHASSSSVVEVQEDGQRLTASSEAELVLERGNSGTGGPPDRCLGIRSSQSVERFSAMTERDWCREEMHPLGQVEECFLRAPETLGTENFIFDQDVQSYMFQKGSWDGEVSKSFEEIQHKRARILVNPHGCDYAAVACTASGTPATSSSAGQCLSQAMSISSETGNDMPIHLTSTLGYSKATRESGGDRGNDGEDENTSSKLEDHEVRMDLTDDLLHMTTYISAMQLEYVDSGEQLVPMKISGGVGISRIRRLHHYIADMCSRYPNTSEVNIVGTPAVEMLAQKALTSLRNLEVLILGKGQFSDGFFHALVDCPVLSKLDITESNLAAGSPEIVVCHDRLRHLSMTKCRVIRISVRCLQLECLSLKRTNVSHAMLNCPQLKKLDIAFCNKLSDAGIRSVATSCPLLTSLNISNCTAVSDETLREVALSCPNLRVLDASYCPNISLESVRLPLLTDLNLHNCDGINSASIAALSYCYMLEALKLDCCWLLTSVSLDLPHLQNISLVHCRRFLDLNLRCPSLSSVTVSNCPVLNRISITSNNLQKLVLQKQDSLTSVHLQCQRLQEVDLSECESLKNSICDVFSDGGGCPMLKSLTLDSCESLTKVGLNSTSLVTLSLVGCRGMKNLELGCPNLQEVFLDGCDHLEDASFCPVGLRSLNLGICPKLSTLRLDASQMTILELKGCGVLSQAAINCPSLVSLDASFCSQLQDDCLSATTASCPNIESLVLMSCPSVGPDGLSSLCRLPNLTLLDLSYTFLTNLQPVFESCTQLKVLKLQACKYLLDSSLDALHKGGALPALRELDLSYGSICQSAIEELLASCTHLTHVSLNGCANMHDLDWSSGGRQCFQFGNVDQSFDLLPGSVNVTEINEEEPDRLLQNLNCVGCPNVKRVIIPPSARCFHLSSLNLSLSANLKEVNLACYSLCFLNLSNCCSLENLILDCPRLTSLLLQSCGIEEQVVEDAILHCNMLETLDVRFCPKVSIPSDFSVHHSFNPFTS
ncbi:F-box/LRR-repeat protein 15 [Nymphaea thermarum]|nr:F-box/LRR-repeat protein 15 [Nymphaea thermarum]